MGEALPGELEVLACNSSRNEFIGVTTIVQAWATLAANGDPGTAASCPLVGLMVNASIPPRVET